MNPVLEPAAPGRVFDVARRLTFDGVELVVGRADLAADRPDRLVREKTASGLEVPSLVLGEHSDLGGIADADSAVAARAREDVERAIAWAVALQAGAILVPFFGRAEVRDSSDVERAARAFRALCPRASTPASCSATRERFPPTGSRHSPVQLTRPRSAATSTLRTSSYAAWTAPRRFARSAAHPPRALQGRAGHGSAIVRLASVRWTSPRARGRWTRSATTAGSCSRLRPPRPSSSRATSRSRARSYRGSRRRPGRASGSSRTTSAAASGTA